MTHSLRIYCTIKLEAISKIAAKDKVDNTEMGETLIVTELETESDQDATVVL